jgi:hypothetical protein
MHGLTVALLCATILFVPLWLHYHLYPYYYHVAYATVTLDDGFGSYAGIPFPIATDDLGQSVCLSADGKQCAKLPGKTPEQSSQTLLGYYRNPEYRNKLKIIKTANSTDPSDVQHGKDFSAVIQTGIYDRYKTNAAALHAARLTAENGESAALRAWELTGQFNNEPL